MKGYERVDCPTCGQLMDGELLEAIEQIAESRPFIGIPIPTSAEMDTDPRFLDLLLLEPRSSFDQCVIGVARRFNDRFILYDQKCVMDELYADFEKDGSEDPGLDAVEWFNFNTVGAWVGEHTPGFLEDTDDG